MPEKAGKTDLERNSWSQGVSYYYLFDETSGIIFRHFFEILSSKIVLPIYAQNKASISTKMSSLSASERVQ